MKRARMVAALLGALMVAASPLSAQEPGSPVQLTLGQAVARGLELSEEVQAARAQRAIAEGQVVETRAGALPQVTANVAYNRTLASIFDDLSLPPPAEEPDEGENPFANLPFGRPNVWNAAVVITQPLYSGGRVGLGLAIARDVRRAADLEIEEAEADIALQVRAAYFQSVLAAEFVGIAEEAFALATEHLAQVELFRQQGTASEFDLLRARVERDNLEPNIIEARNAQRVAELNLKRLINVPAEQPVVLVTPLQPELEDVDRTALREALPQRAALQALQSVVSARERAVRVAQAARLPTLGGNASFGWQAFPDRVDPLGATWRRDWTLGVQLSVPVFDGFRTQGQVTQARGQLRQAELQRDEAQQGMELELESALGEFDAARAQIDARRATVAEARRALELAELRFRSGLATQLDISNARLLLEQARVNEAQALFNYLSALARLERVSGGEIPLVAQRLPGER